MKDNAINLRPGNIIDHNDKLWEVLSYQTQKPGKGGAFVQLELRDIQHGTKDNVRFRTQETIERVRLDEDEYQFLYADGDDLTFMHNETFEQIMIPRDVIGAPATYLNDGMTVTVESYEGGTPLRVRLPDTVTMEIAEADPVVKGQTASSSYKPAVLENGEKIMVPPHIEAGTRVVLKTEDGSYVEKAKD